MLCVTYTHHTMNSHRGTRQEARVSLHHCHKPNISSGFPPYFSCPSVASPTLQQNCLHTLNHLGISRAVLSGKQTLPVESPLALQRHISALLKGTSRAVYPTLGGSVFAFLRAVVQVTFPGYYHRKLGSPQLLFCASQDCHFGFCAGAAGVRLASQRELNP